jgi:hypothetical protein
MYGCARMNITKMTLPAKPSSLWIEADHDPGERYLAQSVFGYCSSHYMKPVLEVPHLQLDA